MSRYDDHSKSKQKGNGDEYSNVRGGPIVFKKPEPPPMNDKETQERKKSHGTYMRLNAYDRHVKFINEYVLRFGKSPPPLNTDHHKTDHDVLKNNYKFIREGSEDTSNWEVRMALKYYNKLFREYCLADMSRYKEAKVGLRWRTQQEVFVGKGQFVCGNKSCNEKDRLKSYEVNFAYAEDGDKKNALVKLRVCPDCAYKLNYKQIKQEKKEKKKKEKERKRQKLDTTTTREDKEEEEESEVANIKIKEEPGEQLTSATDTVDAWKQKPTLEKTKGDEFDEYFDGLFL